MASRSFEVVEKIRINAGEHTFVSHGGSNFVVNTTNLTVIGRVFEGTLETGLALGEAFVHVERQMSEEVKSAVLEKMMATALTQTIKQ